MPRTKCDSNCRHWDSPIRGVAICSETGFLDHVDDDKKELHLKYKIVESGHLPNWCPLKQGCKFIEVYKNE